MRPVHVLEIITGIGIEPPLGGAEGFGIQLSRALNRERKIVPVVCGLWDYQTPMEKTWRDVLAKEGIPTIVGAPWDPSSPTGSLFRATRFLSAYLRENPVDIIHSHVQYGDLIAILLKLRGICRIALRTLHNPHEWTNRPYLRWAGSQFLYPIVFDREVGVSQQLVDQLDRRLVAQKLGRYSQCIYNAIKIEHFRNSPQINRAIKKTSLSIPGDAVVVGTIGRLVDQKDYGTLISAAAIALKTLPDLIFLIVGDGAQSLQLKSQAAVLGIAKQVKFLGARQDVTELLQIMDLFVSSSLWEGLPTVILEAMAAGKLVVATDIPGTRELIRKDRNGWLVPPADPSALGMAILAALGTPDCWENFRQQATQDVAQFSIDHIAAEYTELYTTLLQGKGRLKVS